MNKIISLFICIFFIGIVMLSCAGESVNYAQITGVYKGDLKDKEILLSKVLNGKKETVASTKLGDDGRFAFTYAVETPGIFLLNVVWESDQRNVNKDHDLKRFYLENGVKIDLSLSESNYKLLNSNCKKNNMLSEWNNIVDTLFTHSHGFTYTNSTYKVYFPLLLKVIKQAEEFQDHANTRDEKFDKLLHAMVNNDINCSALNLLYTPRGEHPQKENYPEFYTQLQKNGAPSDEILLNLPNGAEYMHLFTMNKIVSENAMSLPIPEMIRLSLGAIKNNLLKGHFAISYLSSFIAYDDSYIAFKEIITPYLLTPYLEEKVKAHEMKIRNFEKGALAFDFAGTDLNGKEHNLSDFKGSIVYVDVWATWCGPCRKEIPALQKLEKEYHDKPITFMSISVDKPQDRDKWLKFVVDKKLGGVQIMADKAFDSDVVQAYRIKGIPRFMLFDKEGKIVTINADRPSSPNIRTILNALL